MCIIYIYMYMCVYIYICMCIGIAAWVDGGNLPPTRVLKFRGFCVASQDLFQQQQQGFAEVRPKP